MTNLFDQDEPVAYSGLTRSAVVSPCGLYRYWLRRSWQTGGNGQSVCFLMLNPSTEK